MQTIDRCPLCRSKDHHFYYKDRCRSYRQCKTCELVFVLKQWHLNTDEEKRIYDQHENSPEDSGYRNFLSRIAIPLQALLKPKSIGLDFGCGPGPTLSVMLEEYGHKVVLYDIYFFNNKKVWDRQYDFISATEVVEHLSNPKVDLCRLWSVLKPGGVLAVMTKRIIKETQFDTWHYKKDPTHICFYSDATMNYMANNWCAKLVIVDQDICFFIKSK